jgi:lipopolysaccharide transport system permease protein
VTHSTAIGAIVGYHRLLRNVTWSELRSRYAGSLLGVGWAVLYPVLILTIYAVVYTTIFAVQVEGLTTVQYTLYIFAGLIPMLMTSEALCSGVSSVVANKSVMSNTVFPIDLASAKAVLLCQPTMVVGIPFLLLASALCASFSPAFVLVPLVWVLQMMALVGAIWILSLLNVVLRDLQIIVNLLMMVAMIASPIAYTPAMVPPNLKFFIAINPLAYYLIMYQKIIVLRELPSLGEWTTILVMSNGLFFFGAWFFSKAKRVLIDYV